MKKLHSRQGRSGDDVANVHRQDESSLSFYHVRRTVRHADCVLILTPLLAPEYEDIAGSCVSGLPPTADSLTARTSQRGGEREFNMRPCVITKPGMALPCKACKDPDLTVARGGVGLMPAAGHLSDSWDSNVAASHRGIAVLWES